MHPRHLVSAAVLVLLTTAVSEAAAETRFSSMTSAGVAYLKVDTGDASGGGEHLGVAIDMRATALIGDFFGINFLAGLGFTEFERARAWADWGVRAGRWTTDRLRSVAHWVGGPNDTYYLLKCIPAFFAYFFLVATYVAAGTAFVVSPLASMSYALAGPTGSLHFGDDILGGFVEAGIGGMLTAPTDARRIGKNYGPLFGIGAKLGPVGVSARVLWSPRGAHNEVFDGARTDVLAASLTVGFAH
jgi:hypothetical protein